jgi:ribosomal protein S21
MHMGVRVAVRYGESVPAALRRLKRIMERECVSVRSTRRRGPVGWLYETKEHFQKPSLLKRIKKVRKRKRAQKGTPAPP